MTRTFTSVISLISLFLISSPDHTLAQAKDPFSEIRIPKKKKRKFKREKKTVEEDLRHSMGLGLSFPEILPFEYDYKISNQFTWHTYAVLPIPFNIRVELPRDRISSKTVIVDQPELNIKLKSVYGPQFGTALRWTPFTNGFYTRFGIGYRKLRLKGQVQSPIIIIVDGVEITTRTEFGIKVDAVTVSLLSRLEFGWRWNIGRHGYIDWVIIGAALPSSTKNEASVETFVDAPGDNDDIDGALEVLKNEKEKELREKAINEMKPATNQIMPIIGLTVGYRF